MSRPAEAAGFRGLALAAFGLGFLGPAPGTVGSLGPALLLAGLGTVSPLAALVSGGALLLLASGACLAWAGDVKGPEGRGDPGWVVADEVAGQALASLAALAVGAPLWVHALAFGLFRLLDITKPGPIRRLERLSGGIGVLLDDLGAGLVAGAAALAYALL